MIKIIVIIILIIFICILMYLYIRDLIRMNKIPVPRKRFTSVSELSTDDVEEIDIEVERLQELILYTNDLENWIEGSKFIRGKKKWKKQK